MTARMRKFDIVGGHRPPLHGRQGFVRHIQRPNESNLMSIRYFVLLALASTASIPAYAQTTDPVQTASEPALEQPLQDQPAPNAQTTPEPSAQKKENPSEPEAHGTRLKWQDIPKNVLHDQGAIFTSPFHINRDNARWWLLLGGATASLIASDQKITNTMPQKTALTTPSRWASRLGASYTLYPLWSTF